jgi:hypothetical protein
MLRAMAVPFPQHYVGALQELAARLFESRKAGTDLERLAEDLLFGFLDLCVRCGLDRVLVELEQAFAPLAVSDRSAISGHEPLCKQLAAEIATIKLDGGGPRQAKPRQVVDCMVAALGLTVVEEPDRSIALPDDVRREVTSAIASVAEAELAVPKIRDTIIAEAHRRCPDRFHAVFPKIAAQLDERGQQLVKPPKVPLDALQAVQRALTEARTAIAERVARTALDRAAQILARANADAAARLDLPITLRATPRDVAILRACEPQAAATPARLVHSLLDSLTALARITWAVVEQRAQPYGASKTFAVGDLIDHPKFGRGTVVALSMQRIDVEFADGKVTLVHTPPRR